MKRRRIAWTAAQLTFVKRRRKRERRQLHAEFLKRFPRGGVSLAALCSLCKRNGWWTAPRKGRKGRLTAYSEEELAWIKRRRKRPRRELHAEFVERFGHAVSFGAFNAILKNRGWRSGRDGRIKKGSVSWNKGRRMPWNANRARAQFKKGQRSPKTKYAGHEYPSKDGYIYISIDETNPHTGFERRYVHKHRWLWERLHGPIPKDMVLKCKGDKANSDPSNWELVPRGLLPRLNGKSGRRYDHAPDDLKPTIMAVAKLEHRLREQRRA